MLTTDLALKWIPIYATISKRFHENPRAVRGRVRKAWFKLTHRDMGPFRAISARSFPKKS